MTNFLLWKNRIYIAVLFGPLHSSKWSFLYSCRRKSDIWAMRVSKCWQFFSFWYILCVKCVDIQGSENAFKWYNYFFSYLSKSTVYGWACASVYMCEDDIEKWQEWKCIISVSASALRQLFLLAFLYAYAFSDACYLKESAERLDQKELDDEAREVL